MTIETVWFHSNDLKIHYIVVHNDGTKRRLWEPTSTAWGQELTKMYRAKKDNDGYRKAST